ncbi:MAG: glucose PTS transporter subunit IIA [Clostridiales bacterium]|nr:glucose PTS transporter subunit IIA [Clostridiales bacterium]
MDKKTEYLEITKQIVAHVGGMENIQGSAHCATRLRIVLQDNDLADMKELENINKVKGAFIAGNQLQLIFGAGLVNDVYEVFAEYTHTQNMSLGELKQQSAQKQNPLQAVIKALSDVFIGIMPAILAAALLMGITGVLGNLEVVKSHDSLYAINKLASLASTGIFAILPMAVCYSAVKRFGGNPVLGMVVGAIMLDSSLANAYQVGSGTIEPEVLHLFGMNIALVGFQGGIIIALMMGFVVAKLDLFFNKKVPDVVKLLLAPLLTVFLSTVLLFTVVGPVGRILSNGITNGLVWGTNNLGVFGYALFAGVQQIVVITGLHHIIGAVEAQLIAGTGTNFINPLMSVALMGQGGAVLGYLVLNWKNLKARELCIPSFCSTLFGISEPAIFGVNLRYRFPLIGGCIGGAVAGAYAYFAKLNALGFGTTALPGIAIVNPENNGYINYIIAHIIALAIGFICTMLLGKVSKQNKNDEESIVEENRIQASQEEKSQPVITDPIQVVSPVNGVVHPISDSSDPTFAQKIIGDGIMVMPKDGEVKAPCNGTINLVYPSGHALGIKLEDGSEILLHIGIDTVNLNGEGFHVFVKENQTISKGDRLVTFDKDLIEKKGYSTEVLMIFSSVAEARNLTMDYTGTTEGNEIVAVLS